MDRVPRSPKDESESRGLKYFQCWLSHASTRTQMQKKTALQCGKAGKKGAKNIATFVTSFDLLFYTQIIWAILAFAHSFHHPSTLKWFDPLSKLRVLHGSFLLLQVKIFLRPSLGPNGRRGEGETFTQKIPTKSGAVFWLVVEPTPLKHISSKWVHLPQFSWVKMKNIFELPPPRFWYSKEKHHDSDRKKRLWMASRFLAKAMAARMMPTPSRPMMPKRARVCLSGFAKTNLSKRPCQQA